MAKSLSYNRLSKTLEGKRTLKSEKNPDVFTNSLLVWFCFPKLLIKQFLSKFHGMIKSLSFSAQGHAEMTALNPKI